MQFRPPYLLGLNELVGLAYVQNLGLVMKRAPGEEDENVKSLRQRRQRQRRRTTDKELFDQKNSLEPSSQVS